MMPFMICSCWKCRFDQRMRSTEVPRSGSNTPAKIIMFWKPRGRSRIEIVNPMMHLPQLRLFQAQAGDGRRPRDHRAASTNCVWSDRSRALRCGTSWTAKASDKG
jgi:hypothetical protein